MIGISRYVAFMAAASLMAGVLQALLLKLQNRQFLPTCAESECGYSHYSQAFIQTGFMFLGESLCLIIYAATRTRLRSLCKYEQAPTDTGPTEKSPYSGTTKCEWWWWITPAPLDLAECYLANLATTITYVSTVHMLHNFNLIFSAFISVIMFKRALRVHEWLGCIIVTIALAFASVPAINTPETATSHNSSHWLGIFCATLSTAIHSLQNIWEEKLLLKGEISTLKAVGVEGVTGTILVVAFMPLVDFSGLESFKTGIFHLKSSALLRHTSWMYGLASLVNNLTGVIVTKWTTGLLRCLFMAMRPPIIWIIEIFVGWNVFSVWNLISMLLLLAGLTIHLMLIPCGRWPKFVNFLRIPITCGCLEVYNDGDVREADASDLIGENEMVKFTLPPIDISPASTGYIKRKGPYTFEETANDISDDEKALMDEKTLKAVSDLANQIPVVNESVEDISAENGEDLDTGSPQADDEAANFLLEGGADDATERTTPYPTLADLIFEQMEKKQAEAARAAKMALFSATTVETYKKVGNFLSNYRSGSLPKAIHLVPSLRNWMDVLWLTEPDNWSPQAMRAVSKLFVTKLPEKQVQTYMQYVLLPNVLSAIDKHKQNRLNSHLFKAMNESTYRSTAWIRGIFFPTLFDNHCTYKQAIMVCSILSSQSIPAVTAGAALVVLSQHEPQSNVISYAITRLLGKGHRLPIPVVGALFDYFKASLNEPQNKTVIWQQSLMTFVQRWKHELSEIQRHTLRQVAKYHSHPKITPEIRRELTNFRKQE